MIAELGLRPPSGLCALTSLLAPTAARGDIVDDAHCAHRPQSAECLRWRAKGQLPVLIPPDSHARHQNTEAFHTADCGRTKNFQKGLGNCWWLRGDCGWALQMGLTAPGGMTVEALGSALQQRDGGCSSLTSCSLLPAGTS